MNPISRASSQALLAAAVLLAFLPAHAANLSRSDYSAGKTRISAEHTAAKRACAPMTGNAKDVCQEEAKAQEQVARAQLEYSYSGKPADEIKVRVARAKSAYAVAKEKCDDQSGNAKDVCVKEAQAIETKALAEARVLKTVGEARSDAAADTRDADYKLAAERCEALAGDAQRNCVAAAKAKYGKS